MGVLLESPGGDFHLPPPPAVVTEEGAGVERTENKYPAVEKSTPDEEMPLEKTASAVVEEPAPDSTQEKLSDENTSEEPETKQSMPPEEVPLENVAAEQTEVVTMPPEEVPIEETAGVVPEIKQSLCQSEEVPLEKAAVASIPPEEVPLEKAAAASMPPEEIPLEKAAAASMPPEEIPLEKAAAASMPRVLPHPKIFEEDVPIDMVRQYQGSGALYEEISAGAHSTEQVWTRNLGQGRWDVRTMMTIDSRDRQGR